MLPCYWIYQHVGKYLKERGSPNKHYQAWIDLYGGEDFDSTVQQVLDMMDEVAEGLNAEQKSACVRHFLYASRMEYMFWDGPWKGEEWPC
jgi:thiaminase (transcriptional activator TenA)